jgi:hypothetical protein
MPVFRGDGDRKRDPSSRLLWTALSEIDHYLTSQGAWLVNYAERHRAGLRVGTSLTEGTANFLVNRRMNKSQQMRWSRRGADLLLQVRCAGFNGKFGPSFGQLFQIVDPASELAMVACPPTARHSPTRCATSSDQPPGARSTCLRLGNGRPMSRGSPPTAICSPSPDNDTARQG